MSYDRILVDGYSVTHAWPELLRLHRKSLASAREALVRKVADFAAHSGQPVTVVFDATNQKHPVAALQTPHCEVLFSEHGETADTVIEHYVASVDDAGR